MSVILQRALPLEMAETRALPGVAPCGAQDWLRVDEAYAAQMAERTRLLDQCADDVLCLENNALSAAVEVLDEALTLLPALGFSVETDAVQCPDGRRVALDRGAPLLTLGHLVQEDICILQKQGDEHILTGAVLCFPASWRLEEKIGRPLRVIHDPVAEYDDNLARRVQRLFDGVRVGRPLWRFNRLSYVDADLFQPYRRSPEGVAPFIRSERQCILRLPRTDAVIFTIHTYVIEEAGVSRHLGGGSADVSQS